MPALRPICKCCVCEDNAWQMVFGGFGGGETPTVRPGALCDARQVGV